MILFSPILQRKTHLILEVDFWAVKKNSYTSDFYYVVILFQIFMGFTGRDSDIYNINYSQKKAIKICAGSM